MPSYKLSGYAPLVGVQPGFPRVRDTHPQAAGLIGAWTPGGYSLGTFASGFTYESAYDTNYGVKMYDASIYGHHGTFDEDDTTRGPCPVLDAKFGVVVGNISTTQTLNIGIPDLSAFFDGSGATYCGWFKRGAANVNAVAALTESASIGHLIYSNTGYFTIFRNDRQSAAWPSWADKDAWNHVAYVSAPGSFYNVYLNGRLWSSPSADDALYLGSTWRLLAHTTDTSAFQGGATDMRLYTRALTLQEVRDIYLHGWELYAAERHFVLPIAAAAGGADEFGRLTGRSGLTGYRLVS